MATELEKLIVALEARTKAFETAMNRSNALAQKRAREIERTFQRVNKNVSMSFADMGGAFTRAFAIAGSLQGAQRILDTSVRITNALKTTGLQGAKLEAVYDRLFAAAQKNAAPIESLVDLYSKVSLVQNELGVSSEDLVGFTENIALALRAGGTDAQAASGALLQLSQALGGGTVRAEEFNSILEGAPTILRAVAAGMDGTGGSVAKLRQMVIDGELSSRAFFDAFRRGAPILEKMVSGSSLTMAQGWERLWNVLVDVGKKLNDTGDISGTVGDRIAQVAEIIDNLSDAFVAVSGSPMGSFIGRLNEIINRFEPVQNALKLLATPGLGDAVKRTVTPSPGPSALDEARSDVEAQFHRTDNAFEKGILSKDVYESLQRIKQMLRDSEITADGAREAIGAILGDDPNLADWRKRIDSAIAKMRDAEKQAVKTRNAVSDVEETDGNASPGNAGVAAAGTRRKQMLLEERTVEAMKSDLEKEVDARTKAILKAAEDVGVAITEAAAKIQARKEIGIEGARRNIDAGVSGSSDLIKQFEGFRAKPYWDVNAYRAGFGSDTVTLSDGSVQRVTQGIKVSLEDANRDLTRRIGEFQEGIRGKIGANTFESFNEQQKAALTSIAYNYGSLPDRIVEAIKGGNPADVYSAIKGLGTDNGGINKSRRSQEADLFLTGTAPGVRDGITARENFQETMQEYQQRLAFLKEEIGLRGTLNPLIDDYGQRLTTLQVAQELFAAAQREGSAAGKELSSVQQLLTGDLSGLTPEARAQALAMRELATAMGVTEAEGNQLGESQQRLSDTLSESAAFGKDFFGGIIQDIMAGKDATEILSNAVGKLADKLLEVSLNSLFDGAVAGSGGGIFGGLFSWLFGGGVKLAGGGWPGGKVRGPGGPKGDKIPAMLSDGEHVTNAASAKKYGRLLDAINADRVPHFADGSPPRISLPSMAGVASRGGSSNFTFAPSTSIDARGSQMSPAQIGQLLDARDQRLAKQFSAQLPTMIRDHRQRGRPV